MPVQARSRRRPATTTYVACLRAINVAGRARVKMTDVRDAFAASGCRNVRTQIQSGNVLFEAPDTGSAAVFERIEAKVRDLLGHEPGVLFRTAPEIETIVRSAPFKTVAAKPDIKLYVAFLSRRPRRRRRLALCSSGETLEAVAMKKFEVFIVSRRKKNGFYGFPNNFIGKGLGGLATSRNWSIVSRIAELAQEGQDE